MKSPWPAHLEAKQKQPARRVWERVFAGTTPAAPEIELQALGELNSRFHGSRRALLVGINAYQAAEVPKPQGAVADMDALQSVLIERWGFLPENITRLADENATRNRILTEFRKLVERAREEPCVFAFSGVGSVDDEGNPTVLAVDSRLSDFFDDIDLAEFANIAKAGKDHLIAILEAGWTDYSPQEHFSGECEYESSGRFAPRGKGKKRTFRDLAGPRSLDGLELKIGSMTLYSESLDSEWLIGSFTVESEAPDPRPGADSPPKPQGELFHSLTRALWELEPDTSTLKDLIAKLCAGGA